MAGTDFTIENEAQSRQKLTLAFGASLVVSPVVVVVRHREFSAGSSAT